MARARVSCPTFSSSRESKSHRGVEWGHFFSCKQGQAEGARLVPRETLGSPFGQESQGTSIHGDLPFHVWEWDVHGDAVHARVWCVHSSLYLS